MDNQHRGEDGGKAEIGRWSRQAAPDARNGRRGGWGMLK